MRSVIENLKIAFPKKFNAYNIMNNNELFIELPAYDVKLFCLYISKALDGVLVSLFANDERSLNDSFTLYYVWALRDKGFFVVLKTFLESDKPSFESITPEIHAAHLYEREIKDMFGIVPQGHPDQRGLIFHGNWPQDTYPLRKDFISDKRPPLEYQTHNNFQHIKGEGVYEIPVGPVHAGIIEPGHFRFSVAGEPIINLEARLYFVHKGLEKLAEGSSVDKCLYLSERISGDESFTNSLAYCQAVEKIAGAKIPERASFSRIIFAELERLTSHLGDLGGICVDVAYGFAAFQFKMMRGWCYLLAEELAYSRFLRNINTPGGIRKDFIAGKEKRIIESLTRIKKELDDTVKILKTNALFIDRVENTGVLSYAVAKDMNTVGPPGRAAGLTFDLRRDFPYSGYDKLDLNIPRHRNGDINCRMNVKIEESFTAIDLILQTLELMPQGHTKCEIGNLEPYRFALGYSEAPRGENIHWIMTGENNTVYRYKVRTPSFCNWPALCHAVNGNIVPDFPLINKSFNLSYAGNDL